MFQSLIEKKSNYQPKVRSPHICLLKEKEVGDFVLDVDCRSKFTGHHASHFYYVHFGREADYANSIFLVNGEPRKHRYRAKTVRIGAVVGTER